MKLLMCLDCGDARALRLKVKKKCECGKSWGMYVDEVKAEYGGSAVVWGIGNGDMLSALKNEKPTFTAWFYDSDWFDERIKENVSKIGE